MASTAQQRHYPADDPQGPRVRAEGLRLRLLGNKGNLQTGGPAIDPDDLVARIGLVRGRSGFLFLERRLRPHRLHIGVGDHVALTAKVGEQPVV